jgi:hypothetical protein
MAASDPKQSFIRGLRIRMADSKDIPWKRISIEAAAIVASILLAFAIDAWWEESQNQKDIRLSLARLSDNLKTTLLDLQTDVETLEQSWAAAQILINSEQSERVQGSVEMALAELFKTRTPTAESAEYRSLTSTGMLRDISNPVIVTAVTSVYEMLPYLQHLSGTSSREVQGLRAMIATGLVYQDLGDFDPQPPAFTLNEEGQEFWVRADIRAKIIRVAQNKSLQASYYRLVISRIEEAIESIEIELH